ncbi:TadE/TadG family type IV pilus assembly protein [Qipengyuania vesicularis]|uniref:TadE/TadG family type IV pilus assembly protein n=1 Tax=Qipengyuania vesicularis TaxID=2867232 RepID=UPI001C872A55|nr:TadE/TadG family type IV pilus assembly protein [Qipengyuania vesicularis]MBX7526844.1 pilus assembly protein [Qipengyuania vesicularis]
MSRNLLTRLAEDKRGSALVEFALLAPIVFGLFFGIIQLGLSMQSQNSLRGIASDTARWAVVEYMKQNEVDDDAIRTKALSIATSAPYSLNNTVAVTITPVATPRVHGTFEKNIRIDYTPPNVLPFFNFTSQQQSFERPIFLLDE